MIQIQQENAEQVRYLFDPLAFNVQVSSILDGVWSRSGSVGLPAYNNETPVYHVSLPQRM